ncbi:MAG: pitrilysin family protein, partial [Bacteroidota bacterium]
MIDRTRPPAYHPIEQIHILEAESLTLANQIPLKVIRAGEQEVVSIEWIFQAGSRYDLNPGQSFATVKMLGQGATQLTALQINEQIDAYGAFIDFYTGFDRVGIKLYTLNKYLREVLMLVKTLILEASFPEEELDLLKKRTIQQIQVNNEKNAYVAARRYRELVFGAHPYGKNLVEADLASLERNDITPFFKRYIHFGNCDIIIAGKVEENTIKMLEEIFGAELAKHIQTEESPKDIRTQFKKELIERSESLQSSIRIGKVMPPKHHPDYFKILVTNELLGGYFGSRLMQNISEEKGYTSGIRAQVTYLAEQGFFAIGTDVNKEYTQNTIDEIYKEIARLQTEAVGKEELERVQNYMAGSFAGEFTTPFAQADMFKAIHYYNLSYKFYHQYIAQVRKVTAEDIMNTAQKYL